MYIQHGCASLVKKGS